MSVLEAASIRSAFIGNVSVFCLSLLNQLFIVVLCRRLSLSGDKVHARKDAHSNLLSKKETSSLYKIQCKQHFAL